MVEEIKTKKCPKCGEVKLISEFGKNKSTKDGLASQCKKCKNASNKKYRAANPEKVKAACKKCYDANPEKYKAQKKKHHEGNPNKVWAQRTLGQHRRNGYEIQITIDELIEIAKQVKSCPICGCKLTWGPKGKSGKGGPQPNSPSLDRVNNGLIISKDTIQIICSRCNMTKLDRTMRELYNFCKNFVNKFANEFE